MPIVLFLFLLRHRNEMDIEIPAKAPENSQIVLQKESSRSSFKAGYGILFEAFASSTFWWQCLILLRRAILAAVSIIEATNVRFLIFTLATFAFFLLHSQFKPYRDGRLNQLEAMALIVHTILAAILTGFAASVHVPEPVQVVLSLFVIFPAVGLLGWVAMNAVQQRLRLILNDSTVVQGQARKPLPQTMV